MDKALEQKLGFYINVAALVSLITSVLTIYVFVGSLNRNAVKTDTQLLTAGIIAAAQQNEAWATDYGWWDESLELFRDNNTYWLHEAMVTSDGSASSFDLLVLAEEEAERIYGWETGSDNTKPRTNLISENDLAELRQDLMINYEHGKFAASHLLEFEGKAYIASISLLGEHENRAETNPAIDPAIIVGTELDQTFLDNLEANYLIENIRFIPHGDILIEGSVPVEDLNGHQVGQLVWSPSEPGLQALRIALLPLLLYIIAFAGASQIIGQHVKRLARQVETSRTRAREAANTDSMSGLPNRRGFMEFVEGDLAQKAAENGSAAVIYIDLNGFKAVNDKAGHHAGDAVIQIVGRRLCSAVSDNILIARMGGDEFACALIGEEQTSQTLEFARRFSDALNNPISIAGRHYDIGAAIGIAQSHIDKPQTFDELVRDADLAMYRAKAEQLDQPLSYDLSFGMEDNKRRELESDIERGLKEGEFYVLYQPIVSAEDHKIKSVEALLRWKHKTMGAVPPDVFIPIAEHSKLIEHLGDLVLESICKDFGPETSHTISINVSPVQLNDPHLAKRFVDVLSAHGMSPSQIEVELTESVLVDDFDKAKIRLEELNQAGFRINLDDFGTGFASMGYLHTLPFNKIKIDKSFVSVIGKDDGHNKLLQAMSLLGDALELSVVAEGVETESQAKMLRLLGFEYLQGWHFGRPMTCEALNEVLNEQDNSPEITALENDSDHPPQDIQTTH